MELITYEEMGRIRWFEMVVDRKINPLFPGNNQEIRERNEKDEYKA